MSKAKKQPVTLRDFHKTITKMSYYFEDPFRALDCFFVILTNWQEGCELQLLNNDSEAKLESNLITGLIPEKRQEFKEFIEKRYIYLKENEYYDDFFAKYDKAIDAIDKNFRRTHGIYFTSSVLANFALWFASRHYPSLGDDYLILDPACGSGNLISTWHSPLNLKYKAVSEIHPELLNTVEKRLKINNWYHDKHNIVLKDENGKGLNFLTMHASKYVGYINQHLQKKGLKFNKPIAFFSNPPYRNDKVTSADSINYHINPYIYEIVGGRGLSERNNCFLAQMKLICEYAAEFNGNQNALLMLFTKTGWLTNRQHNQRVKQAIFSSFEFIDGFMINAKEFFSDVAKMPVCFTIWAYRGNNAFKNKDQDIHLLDLTEIKYKELAEFF